MSQLQQPFEPLPPPPEAEALIEVPVAELQPTQMCIGMAEVLHRRADFRGEPDKQRRNYLRKKPVPLARSAAGGLWMVDRHHRLRGLLDVDPGATAYGYVVRQLDHSDRPSVLRELQALGWLYLFDGRGQGPLPPERLPSSLLDLHDDPYRSLVWKLKREGVIEAAPLIPFHEFRWGAWLRTRYLPPFTSLRLEPALPAARALARSQAASRLAGWKG